MGNARTTTEFEAVLRLVNGWSADDRQALGQAIEQTLQQEETREQERHAAFLQLQGMLVTDRPPPTDAEVKQWLHEHRMEKYGQ